MAEGQRTNSRRHGWRAPPEAKKNSRPTTTRAYGARESTFAARACKEAIYKRNSVKFLRVLRPGPTKLFVDNYATFLAAGAMIRKWSPASKQFDIEEKFVVECVRNLPANGVKFGASAVFLIAAAAGFAGYRKYLGHSVQADAADESTVLLGEVNVVVA